MYMVKWVEIEQNVVIPNIRRKRKVDGERESPKYEGGKKKKNGKGLRGRIFFIGRI